MVAVVVRGRLEDALRDGGVVVGEAGEQAVVRAPIEGEAVARDVDAAEAGA